MRKYYVNTELHSPQSEGHSMSSRQLMKNPLREGGVKMAEIICLDWCDKDDPCLSKTEE